MPDINEVRMEGRPAHGIAGAIGCAMAALIWRAVRLSVYGVLAMCGPIFRVVSSTIALLGVVAAVLLEFSGSAPRFPFWGAILFFSGCGLLPVLHRGMLRLFSP
jgi:hypothetical protein